MEDEKFLIETRGNEMKVKIHGMMKMEDHMAFLSQYRQKVLSMSSRDGIVIDCTEMKVAPKDVADGLHELLQMYSRDFHNIKVVVPKEGNVILVSQIKRLGRESSIKYEIEQI